MIQFLTGLLARIGTLFRARPKFSATGGLTAMLAAAAIFVAHWEGERTKAYLDRIAVPAVWTVCYGETKGVKQGDSYTPKQCLGMLTASLAGYYAQLVKCVPTLSQQPQGVQVALTSWTYNVGAGAACSSTLAKRANAGDWVAACNELPKWNKAGGKVVRGLTNRRADEQRLCLASLKGA
ncbi:lysozyme [Pseudomonas sp. GX19020]|uniref:lysozyme n=1 Tax=Pseudomonas sp. GX19020 TaxID=2942277 RepID=UPI00201943CD|nr:lysozyme [Pseudomonas sp. GX19020]MCL4068987.1 lysozyme [Pseudomonas sp. GX19020]